MSWSNEGTCGPADAFRPHHFLIQTLRARRYVRCFEAVMGTTRSASKLPHLILALALVSWVVCPLRSYLLDCDSTCFIRFNQSVVQVKENRFDRLTVHDSTSPRLGANNTLPGCQIESRFSSPKVI